MFSVFTRRLHTRLLFTSLKHSNGFDVAGVCQYGGKGSVIGRVISFYTHLSFNADLKEMLTFWTVLSHFPLRL